MTLGGFGEPFTFTSSNVDGSFSPISTTAHDIPAFSSSGYLPVKDRLLNLSITESFTSGYNITSASCIDETYKHIDGPNSIGSLNRYDVVINADKLRTASKIICTFTNSKRATVQLIKQLPNGRYNDSDQFLINSYLNGSNIISFTTSGTGNFPTESSTTTTNSGVTFRATETGTPDPLILNNYTTTWSCTNSSIVPNAQAPSGTGTSFDVLLAAGDNLICRMINTRNAKSDLSLAKTNTISAGPNDQANDHLVPNTRTTYVLTVTNHGPDDVSGAQVYDPAPADPLSCPVVEPVICTGAGCPVGSLNVGQLQSAPGLTLGNIVSGTSLSLSYTCDVK